MASINPNLSGGAEQRVSGSNTEHIVGSRRGSSALQRQHIFEFLAALGISFFLMLFLTRSSFLYPYNNWDDSNSYFSMGKSMFHGTLIYRDLFDQKGPYLYFLYGLCSLLSRTTFHGVFIMEVIWAAADLLLIGRILRLHCSKRISLFLSPILLTCMFASKSFYWGGCAEELCLPFLLYPLYILMKSLAEATKSKCPSGMQNCECADGMENAERLDGEPHKEHSAGGSVFSPREVFYAGLCCGFVFCVKFTLMGFFLGFALVVIMTCRSFREFWKLAGRYLLGILLPFVPWVLYFAATGGLDDWYRVYIYTNVFLYSDFGANSHGATAAQKVYDLAKILYWLVLDNIQYYVFILLGMLWSLLRRGASFLQRIWPMLLFGCTFLFIYIGGAHLPYYALPLTVFAVPGGAALGKGLDRTFLRRKGRPAAEDASGTDLQEATDGGDILCGCRKGTALTALLLIASLGISLAVFFRCSWNADYLGTPKEAVFLSKFTQDIREDQAAGLVDPYATTLLNIGCLDSGLYNAADIYPTCYWFQTQTLPGDEVTNAQLSYITEGQTDYIVARDSYPDEIWQHYELVDTFHQELDPQAFDYYLFRRK